MVPPVCLRQQICAHPSLNSRYQHGTLYAENRIEGNLANVMGDSHLQPGFCDTARHRSAS
jgi:hypothetical protein